MTKDYLAIIFFTTGSSFARGPDLDDCVQRVQKIFVSDWSSLFDVVGKEVKVACFDVTGHDKLHWDDRGVWATDHTESDEKQVPLMEVRTVTLPAKERA